MYDHDAIILSLHLDFVSSEVAIRLMAYPTVDAEKRLEYLLQASGVQNFSTTVNLPFLDENSSAGNIVFIEEIGGAPSKSILQLTGGIITFDFETIVCTEVK